MVNKWHAQITVEGKHQSIGSYENEEEAAVDKQMKKWRAQIRIDERINSLAFMRMRKKPQLIMLVQYSSIEVQRH